MTAPEPLPPGQRERADFPRFGVPEIAARLPAGLAGRALRLGGDALAAPLALDDCTAGLEPRTVVADLHCVTTWSHRGARWGGVAFADVLTRHVAPLLRHPPEMLTALVKGHDGWGTTLPLADLLEAGALLATELDGQALTVAHGAPLRLVVPGRYGYKSVKHLKAIELWTREPRVKSGLRRFLDHPRARVAPEERVRGIPGRWVRWLGRRLIERTLARFERIEAAARTGREAR